MATGGRGHAFYGIGQYAGSLLAVRVNNPERWPELRPGANTPVSTAIEDIPLAKAYAVLAQMTPLITDAQAKGTIGAAWAHHPATQEGRRAGDFVVNIDIQRNRRNPVPALGYAIVVSVAPNEYFIAGRDVQILFTPNTPGPEIAGLGPVETGKFVNGKWIPGRRINGDDVVLEYDQAAAAAKNQSGSGLIFGGDGPYHSAR